MAIAERAHPEHPDFQPGKKAYNRLMDRYRRCQLYANSAIMLDVPCGTGWGSSLLQDVAEMHGLDIDETAIEYGKRCFPEVKFQVGDMCAMPYQSGKFDVVMCLEGYEHITREQQLQFMKEARRVLRPGGILIMTVPLKGYSTKNKFHLHEPTLTEFLSDVADLRSIDRQVGPVVWYVGALIV